MGQTSMEEIGKWMPLSKMESATEQVYIERVSKSMDVKMKNYKLVLIPYMGERNEEVEHYYPELVALCPVTFLPDLNQVYIRYIPDKHIPELKSLKYYLMDYIKLPISHEHLASKILQQIREQVLPKKIAVLLKVNVRGGIYTQCWAGDKELFERELGL
jgi:7-cyano-7-deazaguanine reductase